MKLTREGRRFVLAAILIFFAALNTGNNLIYLILSMMLSILILSVAVLRVNMTGLRLSTFHGEPIFANNPANVDILISNGKKIPSYSIRALLTEEGLGEAYFSSIPALSDISATIKVLYPKRGRYGGEDIFIKSQFPFIFLGKQIASGTANEIIVYPEIKDLERILPQSLHEQYDSTPLRTGGGESFVLVREFLYGDDWRKIHWKASAKTQKLMVKEYVTEDPRRLTVILDNLMPPDVRDFEKAVSVAASISDSFLREGFFVRLLTCRKMIPFGGGNEHLFKILDVLALVEGQDSWESPLSLERETPGIVILILNSERSLLRRFIPQSDLVIDAAHL